MTVRVIIPDSHGSMIDVRARDAFLADLKRLDADEIVMLGDHVDASSVFSNHDPSGLDDLDYSYTEDISAASLFLDAIQERAPKAAIHYIEGNHEHHVERWAVKLFAKKLDAAEVVKALAPHSLLRLKERGIKFYRYTIKYGGLSIPNTIKLGKCYFTHGVAANMHATKKHLDLFAANVVHGHTHRAQEYRTKTIASEVIGGWCPGTLAQLQPLYAHTTPTAWAHGYGLQFVNKASGRFLHINVPIAGGVSLLGPLIDRLGKG